MTAGHAKGSTFKMIKKLVLAAVITFLVMAVSVAFYSDGSLWLLN